MNAHPAVMSSVSAYVQGNHSPRGAATHFEHIPRGSVLMIPGYGEFVVDDAAGYAVPEPYGVDLRFSPSRAECMKFGRQRLLIRWRSPEREAMSRHKEARQNEWIGRNTTSTALHNRAVSGIEHNYSSQKVKRVVTTDSALHSAIIGWVLGLLVSAVMMIWIIRRVTNDTTD